ncbi:RELT-like protein 1 [Conger conger]|uniref:RELT-like protein 1 n=1 Tax=Conger conger TaxID=82655 RepID=UPI002A5A9134|nr:RELT-like protein 1 [Conger conger]
MSTVNHGNTPINGTSDMSPKTPTYLAFVLLPIFFLLGLLGVLICHILKRKGYNCTTESEEEEDLKDELDPEAADVDSESNNDTVNQIVHYIMRNEANSDALRAMVHENSVDSDGTSAPGSPTSPTSPNGPSPPLTPVSPGAPAGAARHTCSHLHTIGGAGGHRNICGRCNQKKWPVMRRSSRRRSHRASQLGEVTVLSVGRFRVTKCDPKTAKERRSLIITEGNGEAGNGEVPPSPTAVEPKSRTASLRQDENDNAK